VCGDAAEGKSGGSSAALEFEGEEKVGELGEAVGGEVAVAAFGVEVVEFELGLLVGDAADGDDARGVGAQKGGEKEAGQGEVTEVIGAELEFEAVCGRVAGGDGHDSSVVDEQIEGDLTGVEGVGGQVDGAEAREIEWDGAEFGGGALKADAFDGGGTLGGITAREDDLGAGAREFEGGVESNAAVGAGDECVFASQGGDFARRPIGLHAGTKKKHVQGNTPVFYGLGASRGSRNSLRA